MCIICVGLDKKNLTPWEAARNRTEMISEIDEDHLIVLSDKINQSLVEFLEELSEKNNENK